jgi:hypothetical protein
MSEREKTAVKTVLEALILKHHLEGMLGVKHVPTAPEEDTTRSDSPSTWIGKRSDAELFHDLEEALDGAKRPGTARRRSTQRI